MLIGLNWGVVLRWSRASRRVWKTWRIFWYLLEMIHLIFFFNFWPVVAYNCFCDTKTSFCPCIWNLIKRVQSRKILRGGHKLWGCMPFRRGKLEKCTLAFLILFSITGYWVVILSSQMQKIGWFRSNVVRICLIRSQIGMGAFQTQNLKMTRNSPFVGRFLARCKKISWHNEWDSI